MLKENLIILRNIHGFSQEEIQEGIALVPAKEFEEKMKHAMEFAAAKAEE